MAKRSPSVVYTVVKKKVQSCYYAYLAPLDIVFIFLLQS